MSDKLKIHIMWATVVTLCWTSLMYVVSVKTVDVDKEVSVQVKNEESPEKVSELREGNAPDSSVFGSMALRDM